MVLHLKVILYQATVAYYLMFDNQTRVVGGYLGAEISESLVRYSIYKIYYVHKDNKDIVHSNAYRSFIL